MIDAVTFLAPMRPEQLAIRVGARQANVERIGMGQRAARAAQARLFANGDSVRPALLLGVAGALAPDLKVSDVVVASSLRSIDGEEVTLRHGDVILEALAAAGIFGRLSPIVSSPAIIKGIAQRRALAQFGDAVDMESLWCAPSPADRFGVVRVISDTESAELLSPAILRNGVTALAKLSRVARALSNFSFTNLDRRSLHGSV